MDIEKIGTITLNENFLLDHILLYIEKRKFPKSVVLHKIKEKLNKINKKIKNLEDINIKISNRNSKLDKEIKILNDKIIYKLNEYNKLKNIGN